MAKSVLFALLFAVAQAVAAAPAAAQTPLFSENSELQILIEGPVQSLVRRAARNTDPIDATLSVTGHDQSWAIKLEPRGISRRTGGICSFPPLRLDFDTGTRDTIFRGQNRIKVVTRCNTARRRAIDRARILSAYLLHERDHAAELQRRPAHHPS